MLAIKCFFIFFLMVIMNAPKHLKVNFCYFLKLKSALTHSCARLFVRIFVRLLRGGSSTREIRRIFAGYDELRGHIRHSEKSQVPFIMGFLQFFLLKIYWKTRLAAKFELCGSKTHQTKSIQSFFARKIFFGTETVVIP